MKKGVKIFLVVLAAVVLMGACFGIIGVYAKNQLNKPKFKMPETPVRESAEALPETKDEAVEYINRLFREAVAAEDSEVSLHTDVDLGGDMTLPFSDADNGIIGYIRDHAAGDIAALYTPIERSNITEIPGAPDPLFDPATVADFTAEQGRTDDEGKVTDEDYYFITLTIDTASVDTEGLKTGDIYKNLLGLLDGIQVNDTVITPVERIVSCKIDRVYNQLESIDITRAYTVDAGFTVSAEKYPDTAAAYGGELKATVPYRATEHIDFMWYGARFTERVIAVNPNDYEALPAQVTVHPEATEDEFTLTFKEDREGFMDIDEDGVMNVRKQTSGDDPVTVTMTLEFNGKTYTDELLVYITDLEVENNGEQQY